MEGNEPLFRYHYSVNYNGYPVSRYRLLTRAKFISVTGIDPVTNKCIYTYLLYIHLLNKRREMINFSSFFVS